MNGGHDLGGMHGLGRIKPEPEQIEKVFHHEWEKGDVVIWDNRCIMHRRDAFPASTRRVMHRTQMQGSRPF